MNVDHRWMGRSVILVRLWAAGLTLLVAGCVVLGLSSHSFQTAAKTRDQVSDGSISEPQALSGQRLAMVSALSTAQRVGATSSSSVQARSVIAALPLRFEPNQGQANLDPADRRAQFLARGPGYSLFLGSEGAMLQLFSRDLSKHGASRAARVESLEMKLAGANPNSSLTGADLLPGKTNYLIGNDAAKWRQGIPQFARVRYAGIYPGIDLVFYGNQGRLEYDFQVAPGSDPTQAELEFEGAQRLELKDGALVIHGQEGSVRLEAPHVYQQAAGRQQPVEASFVLRSAHRAGFAIGAYDHSRQLVIDPVLSFSTYFGGSGDEQASSIAVDGAGNIYLAGSTTSPNLPVTAGVLQPTLNVTPGAQNVYIAKISPPFGTTAAAVVYVTYLGGSGVDYPVGIGVDGAGNAYVAGTTTSKDFPTTLTAYQTTPESIGNPHVFVTQLNTTATAPLLYSTYLSGNGDDIATGMTIDAKGNVYVTGTTTSIETSPSDQFPASNLPEALPFQSTSRAAAGVPQFFVTKVFTGGALIGSIPYSTYFGGGTFVLPPPPAPQVPVVNGGSIAVDTNGNVYFTGTTNFTYTGSSPTTDFPILNAYQPCLNQVPPTQVTNPPTCSSSSFTANSDAFVAKLNLNTGVAQGQQLLWSTYVGGSQDDTGTGIALDTGAANVYITGSTNSPGFTTSVFASYQQCLNNVAHSSSGCAAQASNPAPYDAFVARLSNPATSTTGTPTNVSLTYFSYLGGANDENGLAITVDAASGALLTGWTKSPVLNSPPASGDFPVLNCADIQCPFPTTPPGVQEAFVARINTAAATGQNQVASWVSYFGGSVNSAGGASIGLGTSVTLDANQIAYFAGYTNAQDLHALGRLVKPLQLQNNGGYDATLAQVGTASSLSIAGVLTLGSNQTYISAGSNATFTYTLTNNGPDLAYNITVTDNLSPTVTEVPLTFVSGTASAGTCSVAGSTSPSVACNIPSLQSGSTATITIVVTPKPTGGPATFNGGAVVASAANGINSTPILVSGQVSDFTMSISPTSFAVAAAGDSAPYQVQITPQPVYGNSVSLTVTGLPPGAGSNFTNNPVALPSTSPGSSTLFISTQARPPVASMWTRHFYAIWFAVPGLALFGAGVGGNRHRRRVVGVLLGCILFSLLLLQPACSHTAAQPPVTGTPAGTYTLTVTATGAGSDAKSQSIQLVVP